MSRAECIVKDKTNHRQEEQETQYCPVMEFPS